MGVKVAVASTLDTPVAAVTDAGTVGVLEMESWAVLKTVEAAAPTAVPTPPTGAQRRPLRVPISVLSHLN